MEILDMFERVSSGLMNNSIFLEDPNSTSVLYPYVHNTSLFSLDADYYPYYPEEHNTSHISVEPHVGPPKFSPPSTVSPNYAVYERFMDESRHWVQRVLVPLVMCVGVVGNAVSMVVLTRRKMRSSTNNYLTALAISDLLYLVFVFSLSLQHHPDIKQPRHWFYWQYFRYGLWLTDASSSTSIWITVTFTIERYIAVSHPIKGKVLCTVSRAKKVVTVVYFLCFALTATTPHEWVVVTKTRPDTQQPFLALEYSSLGQDSTYRHTYYWFTAVTFILLPLCLLAVFNFFLIQAVRTSKLHRRKMTMVSERDHYSHQQEYKITVMLIAVVILALVCQMPTAVLLLYSTVYEPPPKTQAFAIMRGLGNIFNLLNAINAAANFILYCAFSDKYRRTFLLTFVPCAYHQQPLAHSFVASVTVGGGGGSSSGGGGGRGSDTTSIKSVCRRVSKSSTPSPMPPRDPSPRLASGSFKENGVGSLDARVTLQYGFGRSPRHLTLSPPEAHANNARANKHAHVSPITRNRRATQAFGNNFNPGLSPELKKVEVSKNHCQVSRENLHNGMKTEVEPRKVRKDEEIITIEKVPTPTYSLSSVEENNPLEFKFIDDESCETSQSSPTSTTRAEEEDNGDPDSHHLPANTSHDSHLANLSSLAPSKSSDTTNESTIHSPD